MLKELKNNNNNIKTNIMKQTLKNFGLALLLWLGLFTMQLLITNFI